MDNVINKMEKTKNASAAQKKKESFLDYCLVFSVELFPQVACPAWLAKILVGIHMVELLAQSLPNALEEAEPAMKIIHGYIIFLNFNYYSERKRVLMLILSTIFNVTLLMKLAILGKLLRVKTLKTRLKVFCKIAAFFLRIFNPLLMVPMLNIAFSFIFSSQNAVITWEKFTGVILLITVLTISITFSFYYTHYTYIMTDHLFTEISRWEVVLTFLKWVSCGFCAWSPNNNSLFSSALFIIMSVDYFLRIPFQSRGVSQVYLTMNLLCLMISFSYNIINNYSLSKHYKDPSFLILLAIPFLVVIGKIIQNKLLRIIVFDISPFNHSNKLNFDQLIRELQHIIKRSQSGKKEVDKIGEIINLLMNHKKKCKNEVCECQSFSLPSLANWDTLSPFLWRIIGDLFREHLQLSKTNQEAKLLHYVVFILDLEKLPNKALNYLLQKNHIIGSFACKIGKKIIQNRARDILATRLRNLGGEYLDFAELLEYEKALERVEQRNKNFLVKYLDFVLKISLCRNEEVEGFVPFVTRRGALLSSNLYELKSSLIEILDKNPDNIRPLRLVKRLNSLFSDDKDLTNVITKVEIRRIQIIKAREKQIQMDLEEMPDVFNPTAGVVLLNLTDSLGRIEKVSQSTMRLLDVKADEIIGRSINCFMPEIIAVKHDGLMKNFIISERVGLTRGKSVSLVAVDSKGFLVNINLNIRVDVHFPEEFLMSGLLTECRKYSKTLLCDYLGNIIHFTKGLDKELNLTYVKNNNQSHLSFNASALMPHLFGIFFPTASHPHSEGPSIDIKTIFLVPNKEKKHNFHFELKNDVMFPSVFLYSRIIHNLEHSERYYSVKITVIKQAIVGGTIKFVLVKFNKIIKLTSLAKINASKIMCLDNLKERRRMSVVEKFHRQIDLLSAHKKNDHHQHFFNQVIKEDEFENEENQKSLAVKDEKSHLTPPIYRPESSLHISMPANHSFNSSAMEKATGTPKNSSFSGRELNSRQNKKPGSELSELSQHRLSENGSKVWSNNIGSKGSWSEYFSEDDDQKQEEHHYKKTVMISQTSCSTASSENLQAKVENLYTSETREHKWIKFLGFFLQVLLSGLILFNWNFNKSSVENLLLNLESSHTLQNLILPVPMLMKCNFIFDFTKWGESQGIKPSDLINSLTYKFIQRDYVKMKSLMSKTFHEDLRNAPFALSFLQDSNVNLKLFPSGGNKLNLTWTYNEIDLEQAFALYFTNLVHFELLDFNDDQYAITLNFIIGNSVSFLKEFMDIFERIKNKGQEQGLSILVISFYMFIIAGSVLGLSSILIILNSFKIKKVSHEIAEALRHFDKNLMKMKCNQILSLLDDLYPAEAKERRNFNKNLFERSKSLSQAGQQDSGNSKSKIKAKNSPNKSESQREIALELYSADPEESRFKEINEPKFYKVLLILLSVVILVPTMTLVLNYVLIQRFNNKLEKIISTKEGIQHYTVGLTMFTAMKEMQYNLKAEHWELQNKEQLARDVETMLVYLEAKLDEVSQPSGILSHEDDYPELLKINSDFYFTDICQTLLNRQANTSNTIDAGSESCLDLIRGVLNRGTKAFKLDISDQYTAWDFSIKQDNISEQVLLSRIYSEANFLDIQKGLELIHILENILLNDISDVLHVSFNDFQATEYYWLGGALGVVNALIIAFWIWLLLSLRTSYTNAMTALRNFPSEMMNRNKILLCRLDQLLQRVHKS